MATRTLTALFDSYERAAEAVRRLEAAGVPHSDVSIVSNDETHKEHYVDDARAGDATGTGTGTGASLGTLLGGGAGLLAGLGMLAIPGLGPVVAAGWLAATLVGAGVGAAAGGLVGALTGAGVSHEHAAAYAEGIRRGGTLVTARVDETMAAQANEILDRDGTVDMDAREADWRRDGWTGTPSSVAPTSGETLGEAAEAGALRAGHAVGNAAERAGDGFARAGDRVASGLSLESGDREGVVALPSGQPGAIAGNDRARVGARVRSYPID